MQNLGFIHDMMDVKILVLYVTARVQCPVDCQQIYELCFQDDCLSYFDVCTAIPELVASGHLAQEGDAYQITDKGKETCALTQDSIAFSVRQRAENAVARFNRKLRRSGLVKTQILTRDTGEMMVSVELRDDAGELMKLELNSPDHRDASRLAQLLEKKAEVMYNLLMAELLNDDHNTEE